MPIEAPSFAVRFPFSDRFKRRVIQLDFGGGTHKVPELMVHDLGEVITRQFWQQRLRASDMTKVADAVRAWLQAALRGGYLYLDRVRGFWRYVP